MEKSWVVFYEGNCTEKVGYNSRFGDVAKGSGGGEFIVRGGGGSERQRAGIQRGRGRGFTAEIRSKN